MPKVSIIIPVYNVEKYLKQCLDSVINQTLKDIEIICVDDGSTDNSSTLCDDYALIDSRIKVIHQTNKGLGGARNTGLRYASGEYILFLDSDDWIKKSTCEIMLNKAIEIDADVVLSGETLYFENTNTYKSGWRNFKNYNDIKEINKLNFIETFTPAWARLYNKSFIKKYNLKFVEHCYYEDNSWGCLIAIFAKQIGFVENQFFYRQRDGAITSKKDEKVFDWIEDFKYFNNFIKDKSINSEKLEMVKVWYFLNFYNYYQQLSYKNKKIFENKIFKILPLLNINIDLIKNTQVINNENEKRNLIRFLKFLSSNIVYKYFYAHKDTIKNIFSITNINDSHKMISILWIKIKIKIKRKKNNYYKIVGKNNKIIYMNNNTEQKLKKTETIRGVHIQLFGDNNIIKIFSNDIENLNLNINSSNSYICIGKNCYIRNLTISTTTGNNQKFLFGNNSSTWGLNVSLHEDKAECRIGDNCMFSGDINIWPTDAHAIIDRKTKKILNFSNEVIIGNNCWIGFGVFFTKSAKLPNNTIVGAKTVITKSFDEEYTLIAGNPAKIIKRDVTWNHQTPSEILKHQPCSIKE